MSGRRKGGPSISKRDADSSWAHAELGEAALGDKRRTRRLVQVVTALAKRPTSSIPEASGTWADTKATYRFFSNDDVEPEDILAAHVLATAKRASEHEIILAIQDSTSFNFASHPKTQGLGQISWGFRESQGFNTHTCLAITPTGVPLGVLGQHSWQRSSVPIRRTEVRRMRTPTAQKESQRWLDMVEETARVVPKSTRVIAVADREADIFDFFACATKNDQDFLVRASSERAVEGGYAWQEAEKAPLACTMQVQIPRSGERAARTATLSVRFAHVNVKPPRDRLRAPKKWQPLPMTVIIAKENRPPKGEKGVHWRLFTSLVVCGPDDASRYVEWYALRWRIERFHYTLKSGCRIEDLQLEQGIRIQRALSAYSIVAWYLLSITYAARTTPEASSSTFLEPHEWKALHCITKKTRRAPTKPPRLRDAVRMIAQLGGFLGRTGDGEPGVKVLWRGYRRLQEITMTLETMGAG